MKTLNKIGAKIDFNCFICNKKLDFHPDSLFFYCPNDLYHSFRINIGTQGEIFSIDIELNDDSNIYYLVISNINTVYNMLLYCNSKFILKMNNFDILISKDILNDFKKILLLI